MSNEKAISKLRHFGIIWLCVVLGFVLSGVGCTTSTRFAGTPAPGRPAGSLWKVGSPIVWYMQGPGAGGDESIWIDGSLPPKQEQEESGPPRFEKISPAVAENLAEGGFNLMFCRNIEDLDIAHAHGLRGMLYVHEGKPPWRNVFDTSALDDPEWLAKLDALLEKVKDHPALYAYNVYDEPGAKEFPALGKIVAYVRQRDPKHMIYINLFPTYVSAAALGTSGDKVTAYREYLRQFIEVVKPDLISYDHYHMKYTDRPYDGGDYFLNLALVREAAVENGLPFLNVIQAAAMGPGWRTPNGDEGRFLATTTLAYGGQGICQFVYNAYEGAEHWGGIENPDRTLTPLGTAVRKIHPEFVAIGEKLQPLTSLGAYHLGAIPNGASGLPPDAVITVDPPIAAEETQGLLLGYFGIAGAPTHVLVVNLDYTRDVTTTVVGPGSMAVFDATERKWHKASNGSRARVSLMPGGGKLLRLARLQE